MKSIRLSLLLYFLGLLAVALGTASLLAYETARRAWKPPAPPRRSRSAASTANAARRKRRPSTRA